MKNEQHLPLWAIDGSEYIVDDKFLKLRADNCTTPQGGKVTKYYVLEYRDWVNCVTIDTDNNVVMLRHYRHGVQKYMSEFVGGGIEENELPEAAARRELEEETGYTGGTIYHVGTGYPNPANHTNKVHTFLAVGGAINQDQKLEAGETIIVEMIPFKTLVEQMSAPDAVYPTIYVATLFYAMNFIRTSTDPALEQLKEFV